MKMGLLIPLIRSNVLILNFKSHYIPLVKSNAYHFDSQLY